MLAKGFPSVSARPDTTIRKYKLPTFRLRNSPPCQMEHVLSGQEPCIAQGFRRFLGLVQLTEEKLKQPLHKLDHRSCQICEHNIRQGGTLFICQYPRQRGLLTVQHALDERFMLKILKKIRSALTRILVEHYLSMFLVKLSNSFTNLFALKKTKLESIPHGLFVCSLCFVSQFIS